MGRLRYSMGWCWVKLPSETGSDREEWFCDPFREGIGTLPDTLKCL
jgi:hypothetical protein